MTGHLPGFVGRATELARLREWLAEIARTGTGRAVAVRGRRGVGKSTLIEELLVRESPPHAFFAASKGQPSREALAGFLGELERSTLPIAADLAAGVRPDGWEAALRLTARSIAASGDGAPACLVIDELPWLAESEPSIEGLLQSVWDRQLRRLPVLLVLIGSDLHMMEALERYDRPLHGRLTPLVVDPLNPAETTAMTGAEPAAALDAYCMLGGLPQLAAGWRPADTPRRYLQRELSEPTSPLVVAGERTIAAELPPQSAPRAVLGAIGAGESEFTKILSRSGVGKTSLDGALKTLVQKRIVTRRTPLAAGRDAKLTRYSVADPYLRFWLRFIEPSLPLLERRRGDLVLERIVDGWNAFAGRAIEPIARAGIELMLPDERFGDASFVGSYWTRSHDVEVDLVGAEHERRPQSVAFVGSIKWRQRQPFTREDAAQLAAARAAVPGAGESTLLIGVSRSGFTATARLDLQLGAQDLVSAWRTHA